MVAKNKSQGDFKFGFGHKKRKSDNAHYVIIFLSQLKPPCGHQVDFELMVIKLFSLSIWFLKGGKKGEKDKFYFENVECENNKQKSQKEMLQSLIR